MARSRARDVTARPRERRRRRARRSFTCGACDGKSRPCALTGYASDTAVAPIFAATTAVGTKVLTFSDCWPPLRG
jgi:hypothetical protein